MIKPYYQDEWVTIYNGDCREILPELPKVDLVLTDPPYGIEWQSSWRTAKFDKIIGDNSISGDWIKLCKSEIFYCFTRWDVLQKWIDEFSNNGLPVRDVLVWDKVAHGAGDLESYAPTYELIIYATKGRVKLSGSRPQNVLRYWRVDAGATGKSSGRLLCHPAEKPVPLFHHIIYNHHPDLILDPFTGVGSVLVAAKNQNVKSIGIEISEKYCEIAARRCQQSVMQLDIKPMERGKQTQLI